MNEIRLGDTVRWTSQSAGYVREKVGIVVQVVEPGQYPDREAFPTLYKHSGVGMRRDHTSYVVRCPAKLNNGKSGVYWPRVKHLR